MNFPEYKGVEIPPEPSPLKPAVAPDYSIMMRPDGYALSRVKRAISAQAGRILGLETVDIQEPTRFVDADLSIDCYPLTRGRRETAMELAGRAASGFYGETSATALNGFVNLRVNRQTLTGSVLREIEREGGNYGKQNIGNGAVVLIEHSSPTIGLPFNFGHVRSALIGDSLKRVYESCGYKVATDMHYHDWNNQIGFFVMVSDMLGKVRNMPEDLTEIYERMKQEKQGGLSMPEIEGWQLLKRFEAKDPYALTIMKWVTDLNLREYGKTFSELGIDFNYALGESEYISMIPSLVKEFESRGTASINRGAFSVDMDDVGLGGLVLQRSGGLSTYGSRDIAAIIARDVWFSPEKILYVAGSDRDNYYQQLFESYRRFAGEGPGLEHVKFGLVTVPESETGERSYIGPVIKEATRRARSRSSGSMQLFDEAERDKVAQAVGIGALKFFGLMHPRERDLKLNVDEALSRDEYTGTYVQYAHARTETIKERAQAEGMDIDQSVDPVITSDAEHALVWQLACYPEALKAALSENRPSKLAHQVYQIAAAFSHFHTRDYVIGSDGAVLNTRLRLVAATGQVLRNGLEILGIEAPSKM
jgi:arginyl-tRNA synthetase